MNLSTILFAALLGCLQLYQSKSNTSNYNTLKLRNYGLRLIVFKEKKLNRLLIEIKRITDVYYNKILVHTAQGINTYNELSEEDKILIETVLSLCY
jgi:hypothetical protein